MSNTKKNHKNYGKEESFKHFLLFQRMFLYVFLELFFCGSIYSEEAKDYFPLAVDNMWVYEVEKKFDESIPIETTFVETLIISGVEEIKGNLFYKEKIHEDEKYFSIENGNILLYPGLTEASPCTLVRSPFFKESEWIYTEGIRIKVEEKETVNVPAGKFLSYRLNFLIGDGDSLLSTIWIAPNVGIVKEKDALREMSLKTYRVK